MKQEYGIKQYKELLERELIRLSDPNNSQFGTDPSSQFSIAIRNTKRESINYAIEMLPESEQ